MSEQNKQVSEAEVVGDLNTPPATADQVPAGDGHKDAPLGQSDGLMGFIDGMEPEPNPTYGAALALSVCLRAWGQLGVIVDSVEPDAVANLWENAQNFVLSFPTASAEAVKIALEAEFDALIGEDVDPFTFSRLLAAWVIRMMVLEYAALEKEEAAMEEARSRLEARQEPVAVDPDDLNYMPDDGSELSDMARKGIYSKQKEEK